MAFSYEYALDAMTAFRDQETEIFFEDMTHYLDEINVLGEAFIAGKIMLEEVEVDNDKTGRSTLGMIIDFIKRVIAKFIDTAKNLFKSNEKWFADNVHKFDAIPDNKYAALNLTILPYWKVSDYKVIAPRIKSNDNRLGTTFKDTNDIENAMYPDLMKNTVSNNIVEGAKISYRGGTNNLESVKGDSVKGVVKGMIQYCNGYVNTANKIKESIEEIQKEVEASQEELDKAMENYSIAEGVPLLESVFATMPWINKEGEAFYITEDTAGTNGGVTNNNNSNTQNNNNTNGTDNNQNANTDKPNPTSKAPEGNGVAQKVDDNEAAKNEKNKMIAGKTAVKQYYQIYLKVATAMMTIAEERYLAYLRTLRSVLSATTGTEVKEKK